jgi:protein-tyrosine-phosphatase
MAGRIYNTLFLCTGNSARSIMAEAILNKLGAGKFRAYSAGSHPKGEVNPQTTRLLRSRGYETSGLGSKSWDEFAKPHAPQFDVIITVCDDAAGETCPLWPGKPTTAHWGIPDPARAAGAQPEVAHAFDEAYERLLRRIAAFVALPISALDEKTLKIKLNEIAQMEGASDKAKAQH